MIRLAPLHSNFKWVIISILWWPLVFLGCEKGPDTADQSGVLIQVEGSFVTVDGFHKAFDRTASNYSVALFRDPHALQNAKYRVLNQLTEELIILERAKELNLKITPAELENAVNTFREDFPKDQFEKTLIESGINLADWQASLKRRLLIEKVVIHELRDKIPMSTKQVHPPGNKADAGKPIEQETEASADTGKNTTVTAMNDPTDDAFSDWMNTLKEKYDIKINWSVWEAIYE